MPGVATDQLVQQIADLTNDREAGSTSHTQDEGY